MDMEHERRLTEVEAEELKRLQSWRRDKYEFTQADIYQV